MTRIEQYKRHLREKCSRLFPKLTEEQTSDYIETLAEQAEDAIKWADENPNWHRIDVDKPKHDNIIGAFYMIDMRHLYVRQTTRQEIEAKSTTLTKCIAWTPMPRVPKEEELWMQLLTP